jgi:hypothetical protein
MATCMEHETMTGANEVRKMIWADCEEDEETTNTCSGDSDDVCSLCSWTTEDDFSDGDRRSSPGSDVAGISINGSPRGVAHENLITKPSSMLPHDASAGSMPVCIGYMPVLYKVLPQGGMSFAPVEEAMSWQGVNSAQWTYHADIHRADIPQQGPSCGYPPGTWTMPSFPVPTVAALPEETQATEVPTCSQNTTVILRNLPIEGDRETVMQLLDDEGFKGGYDFLHYPIDFNKEIGLGYAVVNMVSHDVALDVWKHFEGFNSWLSPSDNVCEVAWNTPHQGLTTHIERYRNSPLMHESVPETYRPILLENGIRKRFPAPTSNIRAPRIRHRKTGLPIKP